jgi:pilus assembly protein Flp/PilA
MMNLVLKSLSRLHQDESGQGLVEYLLILALVAFAATAGMGSLASGLNSAFSAIGSILGIYIT